MIIVFSGCGNTAAATSELARLSCDDVLRLDAAMLRADTPEPQIQASGRHIIWAFPTYSWGVPPVVRRFMARVRLGGADGMTHHMFTTCGDDIGDCAAMWRSDIAARGWRSGRAFSVQMPNTYVTMRGFDVDSTETAQCKVSAMPAHVAEIAAELDRPGADMTIRGRFAWLKTRVVYPWFVRHDMSPRPFHATADAPWPISPSTLPTSARAGAQNALSASVVTTPVRRMPWPTATKQDAKGNGVEHKNAAFHLICVIMR